MEEQSARWHSADTLACVLFVVGARWHGSTTAGFVLVLDLLEPLLCLFPLRRLHLVSCGRGHDNCETFGGVATQEALPLGAAQVCQVCQVCARTVQSLGELVVGPLDLCCFRIPRYAECLVVSFAVAFGHGDQEAEQHARSVLKAHASCRR